MSAEKEIVNYWCNRKGFFTINNLKSSSKDIGILAFDLKKNQVIHIQVNCSITNSEAGDIEKSVNKIISEKFEDKGVSKSIKESIKNIQSEDIKKMLVMSSVQKSKRKILSDALNEKNIELVEFETVLFESLEKLDTQYYKNDVLRTMQIVKFLLLSDPQKISHLLAKSISGSSKKEFLDNILQNNDLLKEFRKTNSERLGQILKLSGLKANELAEILNNEILTSRNRKTFLDLMMQQEESIKIVNKTKRIQKKNVQLKKFF